MAANSRSQGNTTRRDGRMQISGKCRPLSHRLVFSDGRFPVFLLKTTFLAPGFSIFTSKDRWRWNFPSSDENLVCSSMEPKGELKSFTRVAVNTIAGTRVLFCWWSSISSSSSPSQTNRALYDDGSKSSPGCQRRPTLTFLPRPIASITSRVASGGVLFCPSFLWWL